VRIGYCKVSISPLRAENRDQSEMVSQLLFGELLHVHEIVGAWCRITTYLDNYGGWMDLKHVVHLSDKEVKRWLDGIWYESDLLRVLNTPWGKQQIVRGSCVPFEEKLSFNIGSDLFQWEEPGRERSPSSIVDCAMGYLNSPYLWGGKSPFGLDCSGLVQLVFRFFEINLPRDAEDQFEHGKLIPVEEMEAGDVAFFQNAAKKIIHVGILNGEGGIVHASGCVRLDAITKEGIVHLQEGGITHHLVGIKRF
jgi:gamma-D-glutamyl-L-lysine dipeptidyl-peptidase